MQNLLEEILEKNAKAKDIDLVLIKKIIQIQQEFYGSEAKTVINRKNNLVSLLKENLKK
jgi:hypothetical protein